MPPLRMIISPPDEIVPPLAVPPLRINRPPLATVSETTVPLRTIISPPDEIMPPLAVPPET